jgi:hypothetical protein
MKQFSQEDDMYKTTAKFTGFIVTALALGAFAVPAGATGISFTNGTFNDYSSGSGNGQLGYTVGLSSWTNQYWSGSTYGYNFVYNPSTAGTTGGNGDSGNVTLYNDNYTLPTGVTGNMIAADENYQTAGISQNVTGLTVGQTYSVGFYWGGAQQASYTGATTDWWKVSLGGVSDVTSTVDDAQGGFTGWIYTTFNFTATSTAEALTFLAAGGSSPSGAPPFALLADVTMNQVSATPEPASFALMLGFMMVAGGAAYLRKRMKTPAPAKV